MPKVAVLPGDGIGPEIVAEAVRVLRVVAPDIELTEALVGGAAYDATGHPLPPETLELCKASDAVLLGAVGGPKWDVIPDPNLRPERGALLPLRKHLGLYANLRPAICYPALAAASSLKPELLEGGLDVLVVRELTGGMYFGLPKENDGNRAVDTCVYTKDEIVRIAHVGFQAAQKRGKKLCSVDKQNVLMTSVLWRATVEEVAKEYPDVQLSHLLVDNAAMQLVRWPKQFDVIVTENLFGDILSDQAAMLTGSLGMLPSASLGTGTFGLYEPCHGSAPDIAGKGIANPLATILSVAMLLRYSFGRETEAKRIETAVEAVLGAGLRTPDIAQSGEATVGTIAMADAVLAQL
ncbi:3-isopropylmalate dehydrogenase [Armatimonas rosea]|uniref:3-isopropylmalate dehydrogenase n=1 Tax=Armatimonas rosea TaxID=685828 RepID=A0A7W9W978_ARMRO|nr:3-isopropylmalate dehydrogenase [Armatimonas rosea]MBB6053568.1 3-isopropylmalate dehydrogenase [Armatimonas rosea]